MILRTRTGENRSESFVVISSRLASSSCISTTACLGESSALGSSNFSAFSGFGLDSSTDCPECVLAGVPVDAVSPVGFMESTGPMIVRDLGRVLPTRAANLEARQMTKREAEEDLPGFSCALQREPRTNVKMHPSTRPAKLTGRSFGTRMLISGLAKLGGDFGVDLGLLKNDPVGVLDF